MMSSVSTSSAKIMGEFPSLTLGTLKGHEGVAQLIGEFIVRWSLAEATLIMPLLFAMNSTNQEVAAAILSATNSTEGKVKLVKTSVDNMTRDLDRKSVIKKSLSNLEKLCVERNAICHHVWTVSPETGEVVTVDYRKEVGFGRMTIKSEGYLRDICNRTVDAAVGVCEAVGSQWITRESVKNVYL